MLTPFTESSPRLPQPEGWDDDLGVRYRELDALWAARWTPEGGWQRGQLYEHPGATFDLSPGANVLHYGQAIFEGLKAHRTQDNGIVLFRPIDNARRMRRSASRLMIPPLPVPHFLEAVEAVVRANARWVPGYGKGAFYIRPALFGSGPTLGLSPASEYTFFVYGSPMGQYMGGDRLIVLSAAHRAAAHGTGSVKAAGNYAASLLPHETAVELGYADALYLDAQEDRYVEELGGANFFAILRDGTLVTPALGSILPGITRDSLLTIARELFGWITVERPLPVEEVLNDAVEAFYTGTAAVLSSVTTINYRGVDHPIGDGEPGPRAPRLRQALVEIQRRERPDPWNWVIDLSMESV